MTVLASASRSAAQAGPRRIGLFGGTFDPVHVAHVALARTAMQTLSLDELRWIPAGQPWQKSRQIASAQQRAEMVLAAIADEPKFVMDRCELDRTGPSYTLETVRTLQCAAQSGVSGISSMSSAYGLRGAEWFLLIGQDQYAHLHTWHGWVELVQRVVLAVAARNGVAPAPSEQLSLVQHRMVLLPMPEMPVSSTDIRARLGAGHTAASISPALLPERVAHYIDHHGLYGHPSAQPLAPHERN